MALVMVISFSDVGMRVCWGWGERDGHEPHTVIFWKRVVFSLHIKKTTSVITCDSYHARTINDQNHISLNKKGRPRCCAKLPLRKMCFGTSINQ